MTELSHKAPLVSTLKYKIIISTFSSYSTQRNLNTASRYERKVDKLFVHQLDSNLQILPHSKGMLSCIQDTQYNWLDLDCGHFERDLVVASFALL